ncbi:uncharacterized protein LOC6562783 [Drosophila grimshawi]|uniref:GH10612 n=1 Tax=Drosophila grimshawi TaxID=7222 RepID=B4JCY3_DROGR|nr:uncharacterized protein LOC6562783 [Drosophila grimshawi]EDW03222.1 GH10612 [Drosophila grimshawi]
MKSLSLVVILLALGIVQANKVPEIYAGQSRSASSIIVDALEAIKVQMVEGWPQYGIPPLAPLEIHHKDFNYETGEMHANGALDDVIVSGLNEFEIVKMSVNLPLSRITMEFNFASLNLTTKYKADVGAGWQMARDGGAFLALEDLNISGQIRYSTGLVGSNNYLRIKGIQLQIVVGNVVSNIENLSKYRIVNRKLNEIIEEFINLTINDNVDFVTEWIDSTVTPACNNLIGDRTLKDIIDLIGGGGGNLI